MFYAGPMCGRYASFLPAEAMRRTFRTVNPLPNLEPSWNVAPRQLAPVVRRHPETGERHLDLLQWGLLRWWQKDLSAKRTINARAETVAKATASRGAFLKRRAIVPADAFYEWTLGANGEQPYGIVRRDGQPMAFAGLWERAQRSDGTALRTFAIITTAANAEIAKLHDRMPVILEPADWPVWLGEIEGDPESLLHPPPAGTLDVWPVGWRVNSPRNNGPELLEAVEVAGKAI